MLSLPDQLPLTEYAFFLDFDGTLVEHVTIPDKVVVGANVIPILKKLQQQTNHAVALVSGRSIQELDQFLSPLQFAASGSHGAEIRHFNGEILSVAKAPKSLIDAQNQLEKFIASNPGLILETKPFGIAIHFRQAPHLSEQVRIMAEKICALTPAELAIQAGKMIYELKLNGVDKGRAINTLLTQAPFVERKPVFIGDDLTDEDGFKTVNQLDGLSIKVGEGETHAQARFANVRQCLAWLSGLTN